MILPNFYKVKLPQSKNAHSIRSDNSHKIFYSDGNRVYSIEFSSAIANGYYFKDKKIEGFYDFLIPINATQAVASKNNVEFIVTI